MLGALTEPCPEALWPLLFLRELEDRGSAEAFPVLTIGFPTGSLMFSDTEVSSEEDPILRRVSAWPRNVILGFEVLETSLPLPMYVFEIDDPDGELQDEFRGAQALGVYHAPATLRWAMDVVASGMWPPVLTCVVKKWTTPRRDVVRLFVAHNDDWLRAPILHQRVSRETRPFAHESAVGKAYPVAAGTFDSRASDGASALPTLYVDTRENEWRFAAVLGNAHQVLRARLNGELATLGTDYEVVRETVKEIRTSGVRWLVDPGPDPIVTVDLVGIEHLGDGTGAPILTPAAAMRRVLGNFAHDAYRGGAWADNDQGSLRLNLKTFDEADDYLMASSYRPQPPALNSHGVGREVEAYIWTAVLAIDWLHDRCRRLLLHPYWDEQGRIALGILDHRTRRVFLEGPHWIQEEDDVAQTFAQRVLPGLRLRDEMKAGLVSVRDEQSPLRSSEDVRPASDQELIAYDLVPFVTTDEPTAWTIVGGEAPNPAMTEPHEAIADPPFAPDYDRSKATWDAASATGTFRVRLRWAALPLMIQARRVVRTELHWLARYEPNGGGDHTMKAGLRIGGGLTHFGAEQILTEDWTEYVDADIDDPALWTLENLATDLLEAEVSATHTASQDKPEISQLFLRVFVLATGPAGVLERERLSKGLLLARRQPLVTEIEVGLHRAAVRPGDLVSVSHSAAKAAETRPGQTGWGTEAWERRPHFQVSRRFDLAARTAHLRLLDARDLIVPLWELDQARSSAPEVQGVVRLGAWPGGRAGGPDGRRFSRPTDPTGVPSGVATITDPDFDSITIPQDTEKYTSAIGLLIEPFATGAPDLAADVLLYRNRHENQSWPIDSGGTALFLAMPREAGAGEVLVVHRSGSDVVLFDGDLELLIFRRTVGGVDYEATLDMSDHTWNHDRLIAIRWTSRERELIRVVDDEAEGTIEESLPRHWLDIWVLDPGEGVAPVKGTGVEAVEGFPGDVYAGSDAGANQLDAVLKGRRIWRQPLTDLEVEAEMRAMLP